MDEEIDFVKYVGKRIAEIKAAGKAVDVGIFSNVDDYDNYDDVDVDDDADVDYGDAETHAEDAEF